MNRPLVLFSISLIAGILAAYATASYFFVIFTVLLFIVMIAAFFSRKFTFGACILAGMVLFYAVGAFEYLYAERRNLSRFDRFSGEQVVISGTIDSEPDIREAKIIYRVRTSEVLHSGKIYAVKGKILLTTLKSDGCFFEYGGKIKIEGRLNSPKGRRNPGGFDYRKYLAQMGVSATIFARRYNIAVEKEASSLSAFSAGLAVRKSIIRVIDMSLPGQQAGLLNGMLIGYRKGLSKEVRQVFSDSGLTHIMAVSGANVAFIAAPLLFILRRLRLARKYTYPVVMGVLAFFAFITGFEPSVARAVIMACIALAGRMLIRESDVLTSIALAAAVLLICNPFTLFNIGFQLSFAATLSLILFYKNIKEMIKFKFMPAIAADTLAATISAQLGVLPVSTFYFNKISLISLISNLFVAPTVEIITILGSIMAILGHIHTSISQIIGYANCAFLSFVLFVSKISADMPFATIRVVTPPLFLIIAYYVLAWFLLWCKPRFKLKLKLEIRHCALALTIAAVVICVWLLLPKGLEVVFLDVGQGDAAFIRSTGGNTVLIDGGGRTNGSDGESNMGDAVIIPFLLDYGVSRLDLVVATHGHDDHVQGLIPVLRDFRVGSLLLPDNGNRDEFGEIENIARNKGIRITRCGKGDIVRLDRETSFKVLHPEKGFVIDISPLNNGSLVLKLNYKDVNILFAADIEIPAEEIILGSGVDMAADVLKIAHHGSDSSTGRAFLDRVNPKAAIVSVGKNNFGHPAYIVLDRLMEKNILLFRTDMDGAVILKSNGKRLELEKTVESLRPNNRRGGKY